MSGQVRSGHIMSGQVVENSFQISDFYTLLSQLPSDNKQEENLLIGKYFPVWYIYDVT
jgi:hypothetical protein